MAKTFITHHGVKKVCGEDLVCPECGLKWEPGEIPGIAVSLTRVSGHTADDYFPEAEGRTVHLAQCSCMACKCTWRVAELASNLKPEWGMTVDGYTAPPGEATPPAMDKETADDSAT